MDQDGSLIKYLLVIAGTSVFLTIGAVIGHGCRDSIIRERNKPSKLEETPGKLWYEQLPENSDKFRFREYSFRYTPY